MATYVGFLRAINLGARRKFPKEALRSCVEAAGFTDVQTYLNTGNIRISTPMRSPARVEVALEEAFTTDRGFEVPAIVFGLSELAELTDYAGELGAQHDPLQRHIVTLLRERLPEGIAAEVEARSVAQVDVVVRGRSINLMWREAVPGEIDPLGSAVAKNLGVTTGRSVWVLTEIVRRWA